MLAAGPIVASCCSASEGEGLLSKYAARLTEPRYYMAPSTGGIVVDGKLGDADWLAAPASEDFTDISVDTLPAKQTFVKMLWDAENLYIGATIIEDKIVANLKQRDTIIWKENDFEVFIDPDCDGQSYFEIEINAIGTVMDLMMNKPYRNGGDFYMPWDCPGLVVRTSRDSKAWYAEMAIPRKGLMMAFAKPEESRIWRINFSRVEWMRPDREENWVWSPTGKIDMHMPERWGILYFAAPNESVELGEADLTGWNTMWALFYAEMDRTEGFTADVRALGLTKAEEEAVASIDISVAGKDFFVIEVTDKAGVKNIVDYNGKYCQIPASK